MRVSRDPMEPLRCWKELFFGEKAFRPKKTGRLNRRRVSGHVLMSGSSHVIAE